MLPCGSHISLSTHGCAGMRQQLGAVGCAVHQGQAERPTLAVDFTVDLFRHLPNPREGLCGFRTHPTKGEQLRRALGSAVAGAMGGELPVAPEKATPAHSLPALTLQAWNGERSP